MVPFAALLHSPSPALAQVPLGAAEGFAALGGAAVTCTGGAVNGDVGVDLGAVTQTICALSGTVHQGDTVGQQAYDDFGLAYADLAAEPCGTFLTGLSGRTLPPGVYCVDVAATETGGVLTLAGSSTDTWIFKIGTGGLGALTGTNFTVVMPGGQTCNNNVFWWTAEAVTLTDSVFIGSILAGTAITVTRGSLDGQALATLEVTLTGPSVCVPEPVERIPPTVSISAPSAGATVPATVTVAASASDNVGVAGVQFQLDGQAFGAEDLTAPYSVGWNTTSSANGSHTLRAVARDAAGNSSTSAPVTVTVSNGPPPDTTAPTVAITSPSSGATVSRTITASANASDNVGVVGVRFRLDGATLGAEDTSSPYSVTWDTRNESAGSHTLTAVARDAAGNVRTSPPVSVTVSNVGIGDVFVGFLNGNVQQHAPNGTLRRTLSGGSDGEASGLAFDAAGNLYVPHWYSHTPQTPGNLVTRFGENGNYLGTFGSGYDCNPSSFAFDAAGNVYVGQADCGGDIKKLNAAGNPVASFNAAVGVRGADHIDLAPDGCTMFYANWTKDILRYDVCTGTQLAHFNTQPLPGETSFHIKLLPDGGVLVADSEFIIRLGPNGNEVRRYSVTTESNYWTGLDTVGDGTFWANNLATSNIYRFNLESGAVVGVFNTGTPVWTVVGVAVKR